MEEQKQSLKEEAIIEKRKEKIFNFFKNNPAWIFAIVVVLLIILGVYIRYLPLSDHGGKPGLWDSTTNDYTLGPDLDPFLFLRYAKEMVSNGGLPKIDMMRNVPFGFDTTTELQMVSAMIVLTYKLTNIFGHHTINYAGAFMPVWVFGFTVLSFFLFVREIFRRKDEKTLKANLIATVSTLFMIIIPGFLSRTLAGIPEKESVGFFFMFLAFYLFLKAWKSEKIIYSWIFGVLAGIATGLMGLTWGGVTYIYMTVAIAGIVGFVLNKFKMREIVLYALWFISSVVVLFSFTNRFSLKGFLTSIDSGFAFLVLIILIVDYLLWNTKLSEILRLNSIKVANNIVSLIIALLLVIIGGLALFGPSFFIDKIVGIYHTLITPVMGRWNTTVAENAQPYFTQWMGSFGAVIFWFIIAGSVFLFYKTFSKLKKQDALIITLAYVLFLFGLMFSRYAPHPSLLDGENFISKFIYFGSALLLFGTVLYFYNKYHKENDDSFKHIEFEYIFLFSLFVLTLFTARSAVRLIMVLVPIAPIFFSYLLVELGFITKNSEKDRRIMFAIIFAVVLILGVYYGVGYYNGIKSQSYNSVPYYYTVQWQNAMSWVRNATPTTAVFAHWWDYGYWVQSIGERATVTDGANAIVWWNYLTGRYVLTGDNQKEALEFLWNHNATNLLIDSSDIGKYGAYSQIGSDANYDRLSGGAVTLFSDQKQIQETKDELIRNYNIPAGNNQIRISGMEEDLTYYENGTKRTIFSDNSGLIGINLRYAMDNESISFKQPLAVYISDNRQLTVPMRYLYYNDRLIDYTTGINATAYVIPYVSSTSIDTMGAALFISPRLMRGLFAQIYLLNNSLGNFDNFQLVHSEKDLFTSQLLAQGYKLGEFNYFYNVGLQGPIKIWQIHYTGQEKVNQDYLLRQPPASITWKF